MIFFSDFVCIYLDGYVYVCMIHTSRTRTRKDKTMTKNQIAKKAEREAKKFEIAMQIREILDNAKKYYGAEDWEGDEIENQILDMVGSE